MTTMLRRSAAIVLLLLPSHAFASDLIYNPTNPAFGGFPGNFDFLVGTAQIQNKFAESGGGGESGPPIINFPPIDIDIGGIGGIPGGGDGSDGGGNGGAPGNGNGSALDNGSFTVSN